jgi:hypothetical protein
LAVPDEGPKSRVPAYEAVMVSEPSGALEAVQEPEPLVSAGTVQSVTAPPDVVSETDPSGVAPLALTVTEYVTVWLIAAGEGLGVTVVVVAAALMTSNDWELSVEVRKLPSPP